MVIWYSIFFGNGDENTVPRVYLNPVIVVRKRDIVIKAAC